MDGSGLLMIPSWRGNYLAIEWLRLDDPCPMPSRQPTIMRPFPTSPSFPSVATSCWLLLFLLLLLRRVIVQQPGSVCQAWGLEAEAGRNRRRSDGSLHACMSYTPPPHHGHAMFITPLYGHGVRLLGEPDVRAPKRIVTRSTRCDRRKAVIAARAAMTAAETPDADAPPRPVIIRDLEWKS
ncbi:uncharacterized protein BP01DRAFT_34887 [Aspergillus saccharolyticus JOP 1030-1]|uniref:Uncharacterized protein n=1 Tax=Aspergillus saccharolyticus JOP 1030-1 TaxID=1450539 RepID=A0A318ZH21_9EURO|nr:hypothetical protein BP01DRAFT_34887 [Aspergillus saccharolyticus JOP 1030-1]PYH46057.1 hypothetical protein BP01DRAFT_34887 [Aspergillus saccharolyticus JOP 1030-1]